MDINVIDTWEMSISDVCYIAPFRKWWQTTNLPEWQVECWKEVNKWASRCWTWQVWAAEGKESCRRWSGQLKSMKTSEGHDANCSRAVVDQMRFWPTISLQQWQYQRFQKHKRCSYSLQQLKIINFKKENFKRRVLDCTLWRAAQKSYDSLE